MTDHLYTFIDPKSFLSRASAFLEAHESRNNLILGTAIRLVEHPEWIEDAPFLAVIEAAGSIQLAAVMTPPFRLLLTADPQCSLSQLEPALDKIIHYLQSGGWTVPGVMAVNALAEKFAGHWSQAAQVGYRIKTRLRAYELRNVTFPAQAPSGVLRSATMDDIELAAGWHYAFSTEAVHEGNMEHSRKLMSQRIQNGDIFLWDDNGPVSMAGRNRPTPHGYTVTGVYTPPNLRGRGYASTCVAALSQLLLDSGKQFCNLFTDLSNPTSNDIYQKIGYHPVCDFIEFKFDPQ